MQPCLFQIHDVESIGVRVEHYPDSAAGPFWTITITAGGVDVALFVHQEPTEWIRFAQDRGGTFRVHRVARALTQ